MRALINHVVHDVQEFTAIARGGQFEQHDYDVIGDDWNGAYRDATGALIDAWRRETVVERQVDQQMTDLAVHAWDITKAT